MEKHLLKLLPYSKKILLIILLLTIAAAISMKLNSRIETNLDKYMPQNHPAFKYSNTAEKWFDIKDSVIIAIHSEDTIYNYRTLKKIKKITKALQRMKGIRKDDVTSLYTADNIVGTESGMDVKAFYKKVPKTEKEITDIKRKVENNEMILNRIVTKDGKTSLIFARISDEVFSEKFYKDILKLADKYRGPEKIYIGGQPIIEGTLANLMPKDMKKMVPIVILMIIVVLLLLLKSVKSTIFTLLIVLISTFWTFGFMGILKIPIYSVSTLIPVLLIAIGVAYGIHKYNHLNVFLRDNPSATKDEAIKNMIHNMWKPVSMAAITTIVGFLSLLTSVVYPVKYFGIFTAFGVFSAMLLSLIMIPAEIKVFGLPKVKLKKSSKESKYSFAKRISNILIKYKYIVLLTTIVVIFFSIVGIKKVFVDSSFLEKFEKGSEIRKTTKFLNKEFGGTTILNVILEGKKNNTFKKPEVLRLMDNMQKDIVKTPESGNTFSLADYLKRMNKVMNADKEEFDRIPDSNNLIAQYLLLYEMSGDPKNLTRVVDYNYRKANITIQLKSDNSDVLRKIIKLTDKYRAKFKKYDISMHYAGSGYKALVFTDLIINGQVSSLFLSLIIVILLLTFMFKNIWIGLIGSIPIFLTSLVNFGVMGWGGIALSSTTALISSIAIGIGIDYAIHFIERYRLESNETKDKELTAIKTMSHSGRAILFNAIVVVSGFVVLLFSVFPPNRNLGALLSLNMIVSLLGTVTIMFILIYISNIYFNKKSKKIQLKEV